MGELSTIAWRSLPERVRIARLAKLLVKDYGSLVDDVYDGTAARKRRQAQRRRGIEADEKRWSPTSPVARRTRELIGEELGFSRIPHKLVDAVIQSAVDIYTKHQQRNKFRPYEAPMDNAAKRRARVMKAIAGDGHGRSYLPAFRVVHDETRTVWCATSAGVVEVHCKSGRNWLAHLVACSGTLRLIRGPVERLIEVDGTAYLLPEALVKLLGATLRTDTPEVRALLRLPPKVEEGRGAA